MYIGISISGPLHELDREFPHVESFDSPRSCTTLELGAQNLSRQASMRDPKQHVEETQSELLGFHGGESTCFSVIFSRYTPNHL